MINTLRPIGRETIVCAAKSSGAIVMAEYHNFFGGVFGSVSETLTLEYSVPVERVVLEDTFAERERLEKIACQLRCDVIEMTCVVQSGHLGGSC